MQSEAQTIQQYIEDAPKERVLALVQLREIVCRLLPHYSETIRYKMPTYEYENNLLAFASQKNHISIYVNSEQILSQFKNQFSHASFGKNCIRFSKSEHLDFELLESLLRQTYLPE